jgi:hypothetical protein
MKRTLLEEPGRDGLIRVICIQVDAPVSAFRQFTAEFARRQSMRELCHVEGQKVRLHGEEPECFG